MLIWDDKALKEKVKKKEKEVPNAQSRNCYKHLSATPFDLRHEAHISKAQNPIVYYFRKIICIAHGILLPSLLKLLWNVRTALKYLWTTFFPVFLQTDLISEFFCSRGPKIGDLINELTLYAMTLHISEFSYTHNIGHLERTMRMVTFRWHIYPNSTVLLPWNFNFIYRETSIFRDLGIATFIPLV